jgi:hypothetical protein
MVEDDGLEALSVEQLERLHAGRQRLCSMDPGEQARIVRRLLDDDGVAVSDEGR